MIGINRAIAELPVHQLPPIRPDQQNRAPNRWTSKNNKAVAAVAILGLVGSLGAMVGIVSKIRPSSKASS